MKNFITVSAKLFTKVVALFVLSILTFFSFALNIAFFFYRLLVVAFAAVGVVLAAVDGFLSGFTAETWIAILVFVCAVALRYLLPLFVEAMRQWKYGLQDFISAPLRIKSPVRYTI